MLFHIILFTTLAFYTQLTTAQLDYIYVAEAVTTSAQCPATAPNACGLLCYNTQQFGCEINIQNVNNSYLVPKPGITAENVPTTSSSDTTNTNTGSTAVVPDTSVLNTVTDTPTTVLSTTAIPTTSVNTSTSDATVYTPVVDTPLGYTADGAIINPAHVTIVTPDATSVTADAGSTVTNDTTVATQPATTQDSTIQTEIQPLVTLPPITITDAYVDTSLVLPDQGSIYQANPANYTQQFTSSVAQALNIDTTQIQNLVFTVQQPTVSTVQRRLQAVVNTTAPVTTTVQPTTTSASNLLATFSIVYPTTQYTPTQAQSSVNALQSAALPYNAAVTQLTTTYVPAVTQQPTATAAAATTAAAQSNQQAAAQTTSTSSTTTTSTTTTSTTTSSGTGRQITFLNSCPYTVSPGLYQTQKPLPMNGGWTLQPGQSNTVTLGQTSNGRAWGRTGCDFGVRNCDTGDCNSGQEQCSGLTGADNVILAEWTFGSTTDYIDLSSVDAANVPISFKPTSGTFTPGTGYYNQYYPFATADIISMCPSQLQILNSQNQVVACKNGCGDVGVDDSCSNQKSAKTSISNPQNLFHYFANPVSYMQPYGDNIATFVYNNNGGTTTYTIEFCPSQSGTLPHGAPTTMPTLQQIQNAFNSLPNFIPDKNAQIAAGWNQLTTARRKQYDATAPSYASS